MDKFYPILVVSLLTAVLYSCKKDSNPSKSQTQNSLLVGKWLQSTAVDTTYNNGTYTSNYIDWTGERFVYYQFNNDGTGIGTDGPNIEEKWNYKIANSKVYFLNDMSLPIGSNIFDPTPPRTETIISITDSSLALRQDTILQGTSREISIVYFKKVPLSAN